jgi:hypothetical protein
VADFFRDLSPGVFYVMLAFPLAMTGLAIFAGLHTRSRLRLLEATPTTLVASATEGRCAFEGTVEALGGATLAAPLTGAACCWYSAKVEKYQRSSATEDSGHWRTVREATSSEPFVLRDASGSLVVLPDGAEVTPTDHSLWHGSSLEPSDKSPRRVGPGESAQGMLRVEGTSGGYRYTEARIYPGDPLLALGDFTAAPWPGRGDDEEDVEEDEPEGEEGDGEDDYVGDAWSDLARLDAFHDRAAALTTRRVLRAGREPLLLSTTRRGKLAEVQGVAWKGALGVALVPAALAALLLWLRFG